VPAAIISATLIWLLGSCSLAGPQLAAQDEPGAAQPTRSAAGRSGPQATTTGAADPLADQRASASASAAPERRGDQRPPPARFFFDDFSGSELDRRKWEVAAGAALARDLTAAGEPVAAVRLARDEQTPDRRPELCSAVIALPAVRGAELTYQVQHRGVEAGEALLVECLGADGQWLPVERVVADGRDSLAFSRHAIALPQAALHSGLRVRFCPAANDADDAWYLGAVAVVGYDPAYAVTVRTWPALNAHIEMYVAGERLGGNAPFTRSIQAGTRLHLAAAPAVGGQVFSHWTVEGQPEGRRQRVLALDVEKPVRVVAHYRSWVPQRLPTELTIASEPQPGIRIELGAEPGQPYTHLMTDLTYACLTGEYLTLSAPSRTDGLAFSSWVVNGQPLASGANVIEHVVTGSDVLLAEYVRLGDMNGDGELDRFDVDAFVLALIDPEAYAGQFPDLDRTLRGDINGDGGLDALDVESFVDLLLSE